MRDMPDETYGYVAPDDIPFGDDRPLPPPFPSEAEVREAMAEDAPSPDGDVRVVTAKDFAEVDEEGAAALLGSEENAAMTEGSDVMLFGDGGSGKTTMGLDLGCHFAAGDDWIEIAIAKPVCVLIIENEGPRPRFRRKVKRKLEAWPGSELDGRLHVLEDPWGGFSYADPAWRQTLADVVRELSIDVVIVGPLTASGMEAAGTLQETRAFLALVDKVRELAGRRFAQILIHHENRGGKVSGAWEGTGDTLLHLQQQGHGRLRLSFDKTRWSSELHGTSLQLEWTEGEGFRRSEAEPPRPTRVWDNIAAYVLAHGGCVWNDVDAAVSGEGIYKRRRRDEMLAEGLLVNVGKGQAFELWHRDDEDRPTTEGELRRSTDAVPTRFPPATGDGAETGTASPRRSVRTDAVSDAVGSTSPGDPETDDVEEER
jgi:hypothetical protein